MIPGIRLNHTVTDPAILLIQELACCQITLLCTDSRPKQAGNDQAEPYQVTPHATLLSHHMLRYHSTSAAYLTFSFVYHFPLAGGGLPAPVHGTSRMADCPWAHDHPASPRAGTA